MEQVSNRTMNTLIQNRHQYQYNREVSKRLCLELDMVTIELDYYKRKYSYPDIERLVKSRDDVKLKLDVIWGKQIELFYRIKEQEKHEIIIEEESEVLSDATRS